MCVCVWRGGLVGVNVCLNGGERWGWSSVCMTFVCNTMCGCMEGSKRSVSVALEIFEWTALMIAIAMPCPAH